MKPIFVGTGSGNVKFLQFDGGEKGNQNGTSAGKEGD